MTQGLTEIVIAGGDQATQCEQIGIVRRPMCAMPLALRSIHQTRHERGRQFCVRGVDNRGR